MAKSIKTRNNGTMTEAAFWGWIRSGLRNRSIYWKPINECLNLAKRKSQSTSNKRLKFEYQCNSCKNWFARKEVEVDHIVPCGSLNKETVAVFIERLFCEVNHLQVLCKNCHHSKTHNKQNHD
jgi:hypothetical protein